MDQPSEVVDAIERQHDAAVSRTSTPVEWLLLLGKREYVTVALLFGVLVVIGVSLAVGVIAVTDSDAVTRSFSALVGGNMTLITIVISINQLVLSREFGTPAELQSRIDEMVEYRRDVEETVDAHVSPITPGAFLEFLIESSRDRALALYDSIEAEESLDPSVQRSIEEFVETVVEQADRNLDESTGSPTETFRALVTILDVDFTGDLHAARWFQRAHGTDLPDDANEQLDHLCDVFEYIGVLRQYLETLYLQRELALLSRKLFYLGIPAVVFSLLTMWVYGDQTGAAVDGVALQVLVAVSAVVALAPLAMFFAYVLRVATVTRRTAALIPFGLQQ